jgi:transcriptional regulator with XRE-family HTH domain
MKTSEKIRNLRLEKGLSQEALGNLVGVQKSAINKYEKGRVVNIKRSTLQKLADALGVSPAELLDDTETEIVLTPNESTLLNLYRELNDEGQEKATDYVEDLVWSGRYKKHSEHGMVAEA